MSPQTTDRERVRIGVLLAGGESRRMGRDKRGLRLGGETLLQRNLAFLGGVFPVVGLSVRSAEQAPDDLPDGVVVIPDEVPGSPLAGLASILGRFDEPVFAMAADLIAPEPEAVGRVLAAFDGVDVALPVAEDHLEPLHAVYGPGCLPHMRQLLAAGAHSILDLFPLVRVARVPFADTTPFFNVNTPADWVEAQRRLGGGAEPAPDDRPAQRAGGPVVLGVVGRPNSGKTTLIEKLIPEFTRRGLRVGAVKRVARFDIDMPGKDSWRHGQAGADAYTVASASKLAFVARSEDGGRASRRSSPATSPATTSSSARATGGRRPTSWRSSARAPATNRPCASPASRWRSSPTPASPTSTASGSTTTRRSHDSSSSASVSRRASSVRRGRRAESTRRSP